MEILLCLKMLLMTLVGACISFCCLPVILPIFTIFYIISLFVKLLIKIKYKNKATTAKGTDVLFSTVGPMSYAVVNSASRIVGKMDIPKYKSRLLNVIQNTTNQEGQKLYKRLTQTYCREYGYAMWKDYEEFNIDQHVNVIRLEDLVQKNLENELEGQHDPANTTYVEKLKQFLDSNKDIDWKFLMKIILNEIGPKKFSSETPQWQVFFIEETDDRYTMVFRFHHAITDGVYMTRFICEVSQDEPADLFQNYVPPSRLKSLLLCLWSFCLIPFGLWKMAKNNDQNVLHGAKLSGKKRFYLSDSVKLETLRNIKKRTRIATSNIIFSCLSNALAAHFARRSTSVKEITALMPIPRQNLQKSKKFQNKFALLSVKILTPPMMDVTFKRSLNKGCSSLDRLQLTKHVFEDAKGDPSFLAGHSLISAICSVLPVCMSELLLTPKGLTINFSNLPGPLSALRFGDNHLVEEIMFWNPDHDPLGNGVSIMSYNGKFRVGLLIDEALLKDEVEGDLLLQDFIDEIWNIKQELDNQQHTVEDSKLENTNFLKQYS